MNEALHRRAMNLFDDARLLELRGSPEAAREKFEAAAGLEEQCANAIGDDEPRSKGIVRVGAVSLWMQAGLLEHADELARRYLCESIPPGFHRELHQLLNDICRKREEVRTAPTEPDERATVLTDALRKVEEDLGEGRVRRWPIKRAA